MAPRPSTAYGDFLYYSVTHLAMIVNTPTLRSIDRSICCSGRRWQEASRSGWQIFFTRQIFLAIASQKTASDVAAAEEEGGGGRESFKNHIDTKSYASAH